MFEVDPVHSVVVAPAPNELFVIEQADFVDCLVLNYLLFFRLLVARLPTDVIENRHPEMHHLGEVGRLPHGDLHDRSPGFSRKHQRIAAVICPLALLVVRESLLIEKADYLIEQMFRHLSALPRIVPAAYVIWCPTGSFRLSFNPVEMERGYDDITGSPVLSSEMDALVRIATSSVVFIVTQDPSIEGKVGFGTGFCWRWERGESLIVTNRHVVSRNPDAAYTVSFGEKGGSRFPAELVGSHPLVDIAVLRAPIAPRPPLLSFREGTVWPGEDVLAVGNPHGFTTSFSKGIVSAVDREDFSAPGSQPVRMIQTDATINSGNSGGPLFGMDGLVVGVNTQSFALPEWRVVEGNSGGDHFFPFRTERGNPLYVKPEASVQGLNFAVPADTAWAAATAILEAPDQSIAVGYLGVDYDAREFMGSAAGKVLSGSTGVRLSTDPAPNSPVGRVGLRQDDVIVSIDDEPVDHPADLNAWAIKRASWEREVPLRFLRDDRMHEVVVSGEQRKMKQ